METLALMLPDSSAACLAAAFARLNRTLIQAGRRPSLPISRTSSTWRISGRRVGAARMMGADHRRQCPRDRICPAGRGGTGVITAEA